MSNAAIEHLRNSDPVMRAIIELVGPYTLAIEPDIFHSLIDAIVSQQISIKAADAILGRIRAGLGGGMITPDAIAACDTETLRAFGLSPQKTRYIRNLVEHIESGQLKLDLLPALSDEEVIEQLTRVKGIGRWTAEMILIFTLQRPDVLPLDDLGFQEGVRAAYKLAQRPKRAELLALSEPWRPYRSFATWYIWRWRALQAK